MAPTPEAPAIDTYNTDFERRKVSDLAWHKEQLRATTRVAQWIANPANWDVVQELGVFLDVLTQEVRILPTRSQGTDTLSRAQATAVMLTFPGKWSKCACDGYIHYRHEVLPLTFNCGELPPSCHFEEVEETVPAHTRKVRKIVCEDPSEIQ